MAWNVVFAGDTERWLKRLDPRRRASITASIDRLQERGPALGRPTVDRIHGSRHHNLKELRSVGGNVRILFAFDRRRNAVLLAGGDKTGRWNDWYRESIPRAERAFETHNRGQGGEGPWRGAGGRSGGR